MVGSRPTDTAAIPGSAVLLSNGSLVSLNASGAHFTGRVRYTNQLLLPTGLYPPFEAPATVPTWDAIPASLADMVTLSIDRRRTYGYQVDTQGLLSSFPAGYTRTDVSVRFDDFGRQWTQGPRGWRFGGGRIVMDLTIAIYADERALDKPRCWTLILEHELKHAADEVDIVTRWLPLRAPNVPFLRSDLTTTIPDAEFDRRIRGRGDGRGSEFEQWLQRYVWVPESSRRADELHRQHPGDGEAIRACIESE